MKVRPTEIPGVLVLDPSVHSDNRGFFLESWNEATLEDLGIDAHFVQDNHSHSRTGVLRGLHYQLAHPQGKLVRVARGSVFDVAVDLRRGSPSFGRWVGRELSAENNCMLWVPPGCAHGFYTISEADFLYKCTAFYDARDEHTILWDDPDLAIDWPFDGTGSPIVSERDQAGLRLRDAETFS